MDGHILWLFFSKKFLYTSVELDFFVMECYRKSSALWSVGFLIPFPIFAIV